MSTSVLSQYPPKSLADVIAALLQQSDLPAQERQLLASACRTVARILGAAPDAIDADPPALRKRLKALPRTPDGVSKGHWRNTVSRLTKALRLAGSLTSVQRSKTALTPAWQTLINGIPDRYWRCKLMKLARFCTGRVLEPDAVTDAVADEFGKEVARSLKERAKQIYREACLAWNRAVDELPGWPARRLTVPCSRGEVSLPLEAFPLSFQTDVAALLDHLAANDLFAENARIPASPVTLRNRRLQLRQLASALVSTGRAPESISTIADLVEPATAKMILEHLWNRNGSRKTGQLQNFAILLVILAKHWVKSSAADIVAVQALRKKLELPAGGMTAKNRSRLRVFDDLKNVRKLIDAPWAILRSVKSEAAPTYMQSVAVQSALGIALELVAPIRAKNLAGLRLDNHFVRTRVGHGAITHLVIPAKEVKNGQALEFALPPNVSNLFDLYVSRYLPVLTSNTTGFIFPTRSGGSKTPAHLSVQLQRALRLQTGLNVNLHLYRHVAAKFFLQAFPGEYQTVRMLLGHKDLATTVRSYCELKQSDAVTRYDALLQKLSTQGAVE